MKRIILALVLIATPAAAQQWPVPGWSPPPVQQQAPPIVPAPGQTIMTPQGNITRNGPYVQYPDGGTAIVNQQGLTTFSNGQGCRTTGNTTYCW